MKTFMRVAFEFVKSFVAAECVSFAAALIVLALCVAAGLPASVTIGIACVVRLIAWVAVFVID
jgi:hypothetical protein